MKSMLPNLRLVSLPSQNLGQDWMERVTELDILLYESGFELASEEVYLLFSHAPGSVLNGEGSCQVARSVVGHKKELTAPFVLIDVISGPVYCTELKGSTWTQSLHEAFKFWESLHREGHKIGRPFMIRLLRRMNPGLVLAQELLLSE